MIHFSKMSVLSNVAISYLLLTLFTLRSLKVENKTEDNGNTRGHVCYNTCAQFPCALKFSYVQPSLFCSLNSVEVFPLRRYTVIPPVREAGHFAVYDSVLTIVTVQVSSSDHHPSKIASAVIAVFAVADNEAACKCCLGSKEVPWLGFHVTPGIFSQFIELEPVHVV